MKTRYIIGIIAVVLLLALSGCKNAGEVVEEGKNVEEEVSGAATAEKESSETEDIDVKELIKKLSEEAGLDTEEAAEEEEAASEVTTVVIDNFKGSPEDFNVKIGATVTWTSDQPNFKHMIGILQVTETGKKVKVFKPEMQLLKGESVQYTFNETGDFIWYSATNYPDTQGDIEVTE